MRQHPTSNTMQLLRRSIMSHTIYWIHEPSHTDPYTEGYIGITGRPINERFDEHGDRFGTNVVKDVLLTGITEQQSIDLEEHYRPTWYIGWNIAPGGKLGRRPPGIHTSGWSHSEESRKKRSEDSKERDIWKRFIGADNPNQGGPGKPKPGTSKAMLENNPAARKVTVDGVTYNSQSQACEALGVSIKRIREYLKGGRHPLEHRTFGPNKGAKYKKKAK